MLGSSGITVARLNGRVQKVGVAIAVLLLLFLLAPIASVQSQSPEGWQQLSPATSPSPRQAHALAYDVQSDRIILFGGHTAGGPNGETWAYDLNSNTWTNMQPSPSPSPRTNHAMAYDAGSDQVILFGGFPGFGDTWAYAFETNTWANMAPATAPSVRWDHRVAYDAQSDRVVIYAGHDASGSSDIQYSETWAYNYDANAWSDLSSSPRPPAIGQYDLAYDTDSDRIVHFGGREPPSLTGSDQTWAYDLDANSWIERNPATRPAARMEHAMAYDAESDRVILSGGGVGTAGGGTAADAFSDTWAYDFDSNLWTRLDSPTRPSARLGHRLAYDIESDRVVMFGGGSSSREPSSYNDETWAFDFNTVRPHGGLDWPLVVGVTAIVVGATAAVILFVWRKRKLGGPRQG